MPDPIIRPGKAWRGTPIQILDLLLGLNQQPVLSADLAGFDLRVFDESNPELEVFATLEENTDVAGHIEDVLRTDEGWAQGGAGWNFRYVVSSDFTSLLAGGNTYRFEFRFNTPDAEHGPLFLVYSIYFEPMGTDPVDML